MQLLSLLNGLIAGITPVSSSAGASSAGSVVVLNSSGQVDSTMLPASTGGSTVGTVDGGNSSPLVATELPSIDGGVS